MALPSSFTVAQAIDDAFERIQIDPKGITAEHVVSARRSIRLILDTWNNDSVLFWKVADNQQAPLVINQGTFSLVAGAIDIIDAAILRSGYTTPITMISESDWFAIPDKGLNVGMPRMCWVQRTIAGPIANLYPLSENTTDIVVYNAMLQFNDSSQLSASADIPFRWNNAFTSGLCAFLAEKFKPEVFMAKMAKYGGPGVTNRAGEPPSDYQIARMGDRERGDTITVVHKSRRWHR